MAKRKHPIVLRCPVTAEEREQPKNQFGPFPCSGALRSERKGHRFESCYLDQEKPLNVQRFFYFKTSAYVISVFYEPDLFIL